MAFSLAAGIGFVLSSKEKVQEAKADEKKDLSEIISFGSLGDQYQYIDNLFVTFNLSEDISPSYHGYVNDHWDSFQSSSNLDFYNGLIINGKTMGEWISYNDGEMGVYPNNTFVNAFPMNNGGKYGPVAVEAKSSKIDFKFVLEYFPLTDITITFKADAFVMDSNSNYKLDNDLTFKSTLPSNSGEFSSVKFVKLNELNEAEKEFSINHVDYWGNLDNELNYTYRQYVLWTDVPRNSSLIKTYSWAADHYRYFFEDILLNNKPIMHYLSWARGNNKDFLEQTTWSANPSGSDWTQNPAYTMKHPLGSQCANYDTAVQLNVALDQPNYVFFIYIPEQMFADYAGLNAPLFSIREGALWQSLDENSNPILARNTKLVDNASGVNATKLSVETRSDGAGLLLVHFDGAFNIGYNFSDKKMGLYGLDVIKIDGKSINYWNSNSPVELTSGFDYEGFRLEAALNKAIITYSSNNTLQLIIHPDLWAEWKNSNHTVYLPANLGTYRDGGAEYYYIKNEFSSSSLDYYLSEIIDLLDGEYSKSALASVKEKYNALPDFAKTAFDDNDEYASYRNTINDWEFLKYKDDANDELLAYKSGDFREAEENDRLALINDAADDIASATTKAEVDEIVSDTKALIDNLKTREEYEAEELEEYINAAVAELNNYKDEEDYLEADWAIIEGIVASATDELQTATNNAGVNQIVAVAKEDMDNVPTKVQRELAETKTNAINELDAIDTSIYRQEEKEEVEAIIATAKTNINNAAAKEEVATLLANAKTAIAAVKTDAQKTEEELNEAKANAKAELEAYKNDEGLFRDAEVNRRLEIIASGKEAIDNAANKDAVNTALANAKGQIDALKTAAEYDAEEAFNNIKAAAKQELDDYATAKGANNYSTAGWQQIQGYVNTGKTQIDSASTDTEAKINQIVASIKGLIDTVPTKAEEELETAKENAISDLNSYYNNIDKTKYTQENANKLATIKENGERAIEAATSVDEVNAALQEAKNNLDAVEKIETKKSSGCGGYIASTSIILSAIALTGIALLFLKKKNEF